MKNDSFYELFCAQYRCQPADFNRVVLRHCFYRCRYYFGRSLALLQSDYFSLDLALIEAIKPLTSAMDVEAEISAFREIHPHEGLFHDFLKVRLSGRRLIGEAQRLFASGSSKDVAVDHLNPANLEMGKNKAF
jgi:hypothetical protein